MPERKLILSSISGGNEEIEKTKEIGNEPIALISGVDKEIKVEEPQLKTECEISLTMLGDFENAEKMEETRLMSESIHTDEKPLFCQICHCFCQQSHFNLHHVIPKEEKRFQCKVCACGFHTEIELVRHQKSHTGEKPFKCQKCKSTFSKKTNLARHERIHNGE